MEETLSERERKTREEKERKKADVRARLEAASRTTPVSQKKRFLTSERKKKLRVLLRKNATEQLKLLEQAKAVERRRVIDERTGVQKNIDSMNKDSTSFAFNLRSIRRDQFKASEQQHPDWSWKRRPSGES
ncbi:Troponin I 1, partial [Fragariocoptes setiger]